MEKILEKELVILNKNYSISTIILHLLKLQEEGYTHIYYNRINNIAVVKSNIENRLVSYND